jgi:hypothetical protein
MSNNCHCYCYIQIFKALELTNTGTAGQNRTVCEEDVRSLHMCLSESVLVLNVEVRQIKFPRLPHNSVLATFRIVLCRQQNELGLQSF